MKKWKDVVEVVGIAAIVASLIFVGLELKQSREIAVASFRDSTYSAWRTMNFERMNAGWYWEIVEKLNGELRDPGPHTLGIPVSTKTKWEAALAKLTPEEYGRFTSFHLQERNEARRLFELSDSGLGADGYDGSFLISIRAPLWLALFGENASTEFDRFVLDAGTE